MRSKPRILLGVGSAAAVLLLPAAAAFACSTLATLNLSVGEGRPGTTVVVTGSSFRPPDPSPAAPLPVVVRWNGIDGPPVASAVPDASGAISASFVVPAAGPGAYVLVATQPNPAAGDRYGFIARADYRVVGTGQASQAGQDASAGRTSAWMLAATALSGTLGLGLFCGGFVAVAAGRRRRAAGARSS